MPQENGPTDPNGANFAVPTHAVEAQAAHLQDISRSLPPAQTSHRAEYWTPPTDAQVAKAARYGFDLTQQEKYHSPATWANRNK